MMYIPSDLKAEILLNYLSQEKRQIKLCGTHKRTAYRDVLELIFEEQGGYDISISRNGLYDILPEGLFHSIDRFEDIPTNEREKRFHEACEEQQAEEDNARLFFRPFDEFLLDLSCKVLDMECRDYSDNKVLVDILCDDMPDEYRHNRFVTKAKSFIPECSRIRGDKTLLSLMCRKIFNEEGLQLELQKNNEIVCDRQPRYSCYLNGEDEVYLGNEFPEEITTYKIHYWNDSMCDSTFLDFVEEVGVFERFLNDYFVGIESKIKFDISTDTLPVRLSDDMCYNYLSYNTNI